MTDRYLGSADLLFPDLFPDRELTPDERAAHDEDPRPGSCFAPGTGESHLVGQSDTDLLIRVELWSQAPSSARSMLEELIRIPRWRPGAITDPMVPTTYQRGGIDSDPFVRLLAYRAWGDRDRTWFQDRGVRAGDALAVVDDIARGVWVGCAWPGELVIAHAARDARPGELVELVKYHPVVHRGTELRETEARVADRRRVAPLRAGG